MKFGIETPGVGGRILGASWAFHLLGKGIYELCAKPVYLAQAASSFIENFGFVVFSCGP